MEVHYAERGIIGLINISSCVNLEPELYAMAPDGIAILTGRISLPRTTPEELAKLAEKAEAVTAELATAKPDIILFACTSGSFVNGKNYDTEISLRLSKVAGGIPVLTTTTAVVNALNALHAKSISFGTPYIESVNRRAEKYFTDNGFNMQKIEGLGLDTDYEIGLQTTDTICDLARRVDMDASDVVVLSCTNIKTAPILDKLESELHKPVVSANQAMLWNALREIGVNDKIPGLGSLFML